MCALEIERRALAGVVRPGVELHVTGMGADHAADVGERLCARPLRALVATGFCGALRPGISTGTVIAADVVVHENTGAAFDADPTLLAAADGRRGILVSASELARTPADRAALHGLAVDMESASLARAAHEAGIPFLALRAVSDRFRDRVPDLAPLLDHLGRPDRGRLLAHLVRHPRDLPRLARLGRGARRAGSALGCAVASLLARIDT